MDFEGVARVSDFESARTLCVSIKGHEILLCRTEEGYFAVDNICTHAHARMNEGRLRGMRIFCPLHGASFDVRSGKALSRPATRALRSFPVLIKGDEIHVAVVDELEQTC